MVTFASSHGEFICNNGEEAFMANALLDVTMLILLKKFFA